MSEKKRFLLRLDGELWQTLEKWAADDLRSVNAQIEYLLSESVRRAGRARRGGTRESDSAGEVSRKDAKS
jgi:hypothetical protein